MTAKPTIFVKAFNRPFMLERCLRSIEQFATGHGDVIVLDDGTLGPYVDRIRTQFPTVRYRFARQAEIRYDVARRKTSRKLLGLDDPSALWIDGISADDGDYMLLIEEDCWLAHPVDIALLANVMRGRNALMCRLFWCSSPRLGADADDVFEHLGLSPTMALDFYVPKPSEIVLDQIKLFAIANQIFARDYWLYALTDLPVWNDEITQFRNARAYVGALRDRGLPASFCQSSPEIIRQSWSSTSTAEDFDPFAINDAFNRAWFEGHFDPMTNFPFDLPEAYMAAHLEPFVTPADLSAWRVWRHSVRNTYAMFGSDIDKMFF